MVKILKVYFGGRRQAMAQSGLLKVWGALFPHLRGGYASVCSGSSLHCRLMAYALSNMSVITFKKLKTKAFSLLRSTMGKNYCVLFYISTKICKSAKNVLDQ